MGSFYRSKHELILVFKNGTAAHINNIELGRFGRNRTNVWNYPGANSLRDGRRDELAMHPTTKPVSMVADAILDCSKRGGIILDSFGGSGTTLIAAEKTGRRAALMELDPTYVDLTIKRFQKLTGEKVTHAETGLTFDEMQAERATASEAEAKQGTRMKDYEVGYKKPPKDSQFKKGESGNPKGRKKNTRNLKTDLTKILEKRISVREGERKFRVSGQEGMLMSLMSVKAGLKLHQ
jgi:hypothetical protein